MDERTEDTKVNLPALVSKRPFQPGSRAPILSIRICSSALLVRPKRNGKPRYRQGNWHALPVKPGVMVAKTVSSQLMGYISDFCILVNSPVASPKHCRMCCRLVISCWEGRRKRAASSAYKLVCSFIGSVPIGWRSPCAVAMSSTRWSGSIARM